MRVKAFHLEFELVIGRHELFRHLVECLKSVFQMV